MNTKPPTTRGLIALSAFVLVCFGLTLYMWLVFGGTAPLQPKSYRITVPFADAGSIARQADVRIAGVNVGKVVKREINPATGSTDLELEIAPQYAPLHTDVHAILRQKTLIGETYVALTPGTPATPILHDGGRVAAGAVSETVRLDDVLRTFDPVTRKALATWLTEQGTALRGGGPALSAALAQLPPLGEYGGQVLDILHQEGTDLHALIRDGGASLGALTERRGQLRSLVRNSNAVFRTTAARDSALADTFRTFPGFLRETRATLTALGDFSGEATPLARQLEPAARELTPVLRSGADLAPDLKRLLAGIGPLATAARTGLPAVDGVLSPSVPLLRRLKPYLGTLIPVVDYVDTYKRELAGFFANISAATQATLPATDGSGPLHYARASLPINPESLAAYPTRLSSSRANAYPQPGRYTQLASSGLPVFDAQTCVSHALPTLSTSLPDAQRTEIHDYYFTDNPDGPACRAQEPLGSVIGTGDTYPTLEALP